MKNVTTAIILGTRPEIIKLSPVIREYEKNNLDIVSAAHGQHTLKDTLVKEGIGEEKIFLSRDIVVDIHV